MHRTARKKSNVPNGSKGFKVLRIYLTRYGLLSKSGNVNKFEFLCPLSKATEKTEKNHVLLCIYFILNWKQKLCLQRPAIFWLYTRAKIQMLTTFCRILTLIYPSFLKSIGLYCLFYILCKNPWKLNEWNVGGDNFPLKYQLIFPILNSIIIHFELEDSFKIHIQFLV